MRLTVKGAIEENTYDVIVIGLGPSGFASAKILSEGGLRVLVIEKSDKFRKVCGGLLCEEAIEFMLELNIAPPQNALNTPLELVDFDNSICWDTKRTLLSVERGELNRTLFENLNGCTEIINERVTSITLHDNYIAVKTSNDTFHASFIIGADGVNSTIRKLLGISPPPKITVLQARIRMNSSSDSTLFIFDTKISKTYYSYFIPKRGYAIAGTKYASRDSIKRLLKRLKSLKMQFEVVGYESWRLTFIDSLEKVSFGKGNVLLVGEAAGFVSPSSGEGISFAFESGMLAGNAILKAADSEKNSCHVYREMCKSLIERLNSRIEKSKLIFNPEFRKEYFGRYYDGHNIEGIQEKA